jgi:hypothetical protein
LPERDRSIPAVESGRCTGETGTTVRVRAIEQIVAVVVAAVQAVLGCAVGQTSVTTPSGTSPSAASSTGPDASIGADATAAEHARATEDARAAECAPSTEHAGATECSTPTEPSRPASAAERSGHTERSAEAVAAECSTEAVAAERSAAPRRSATSRHSTASRHSAATQGSASAAATSTADSSRAAIATGARIEFQVQAVITGTTRRGHAEGGPEREQRSDHRAMHRSTSHVVPAGHPAGPHGIGSHSSVTGLQASPAVHPAFLHPPAATWSTAAVAVTTTAASVADARGTFAPPQLQRTIDISSRTHRPIVRQSAAKRALPQVRCRLHLERSC